MKSRVTDMRKEILKKKMRLHLDGTSIITDVHLTFKGYNNLLM